jgi:hypothetical protein
MAVPGSGTIVSSAAAESKGTESEGSEGLGWPTDGMVAQLARVIGS